MIYVIDGIDEGPVLCHSKQDVFLKIKEDAQNYGEITKIWVSEWERTTSITQTFRDVSEDIAKEFFNQFSNDYDDVSYVPEFITNNVDEDYVQTIMNNQSSQCSDYKEHNTMNRAQQGV